MRPNRAWPGAVNEAEIFDFTLVINGNGELCFLFHAFNVLVVLNAYYPCMIVIVNNFLKHKQAFNGIFSALAQRIVRDLVKGLFIRVIHSHIDGLM